mgnify:CR=1 FL=1
MAHCEFVATAQLVAVRGSDASGADDAEPPESEIEYSDDEAEAEAMAAKLEVDLATFYAQFTRKKGSELKETKAGRHGWDCIMCDGNTMLVRRRC